MDCRTQHLRREGFLQLRFELFNVLTHPVLPAPDTTASNALFGTISGAQSNRPHSIQLGAIWSSSVWHFATDLLGCALSDNHRAFLFCSVKPSVFFCLGSAGARATNKYEIPRKLTLKQLARTFHKAKPPGVPGIRIA